MVLSCFVTSSCLGALSVIGSFGADGSLNQIDLLGAAGALCHYGSLDEYGAVVKDDSIGFLGALGDRVSLSVPGALLRNDSLSSHVAMQVRGSLAHDGALFVFGSLSISGDLRHPGSLAFNEADIESWLVQCRWRSPGEWLTSACWCSDMYLGSFSLFGALCPGDSLLYHGALIDYG
jgi:hypothetical protein